MFDGIENITDTNNIMEEFEDHITQFTENDNESNMLYCPTEINVDEFEQLFGLKINDNVVCVCVSMMPIIMYIAKEMDWTVVDWKIIPINIK